MLKSDHRRGRCRPLRKQRYRQQLPRRQRHLPWRLRLPSERADLTARALSPTPRRVALLRLDTMPGSYRFIMPRPVYGCACSQPTGDGNDLKSLLFRSEQQFIWVTSDKNVLGLNVDLKKQSVTRFIASCADDANIRLWHAKTAGPTGVPSRSRCSRCLCRLLTRWALALVSRQRWNSLSGTLRS